MRRTYRLGSRLSFRSLRQWALGSAAAFRLLILSPRSLERLDTEASGRYLVKWSERLFRTLDVRLDVRGLDDVGAGPYVIVALHEGFLDVPTLLHLPLPMRFTVREELAEWKTLGRGIAASDQIVLDTTRPRVAYRKLLREGSEILDGGESVVVFPQGSVLGVEIAFERGAGGLAAHAGVPILPVVITGSHRAWDYPFDTCLNFGQTITMEVLPERQSMSGLEAEMRALALDGHRAAPRRFDPTADGWWDDYAFSIAPEFDELRSAIEHRRATR